LRENWMIDTVCFPVYVIYWAMLGALVGVGGMLASLLLGPKLRNLFGLEPLPQEVLTPLKTILISGALVAGPVCAFASAAIATLCYFGENGLRSRTLPHQKLQNQGVFWVAHAVTFLILCLWTSFTWLFEDAYFADYVQNLRSTLPSRRLKIF